MIFERKSDGNILFFPLKRNETFVVVISKELSFSLSLSLSSLPDELSQADLIEPTREEEEKETFRDD